MWSMELSRMQRLFGEEPSSVYNMVIDFKDSIEKRAEELILKGFPETIVKLNDLLETLELRNKESIDVYQNLNISIPDPIVFNGHIDLPTIKKTSDDSISQDGTKVLILPSGSVPSNNQLIELVEAVKPHLRKLVEDSDLLKMWISFMIPKIEDGNNFGVSIQANTLAEVQCVEAEAEAFFEEFAHYFKTRAKLVSKVAKYPYIDDYRRAVHETDEKEYRYLWFILIEIRNQYCLLHDMVLKNLDKIKKPRSTNTNESMY